MLLVLSMGIIVWMRKLPGVFCVAQIKRHHGDISIDVMILTIFQEELARKRQLPVPPMPRRGPRAIARSEDNVSGESWWWKLNMSLWCKKMTSGLCFGMWCGEAEEEN